MNETDAAAETVDYRTIPLWKRNWILCWSFLKITALVIGGGYAIIAAAQEEFVRRRRWLSEDDVIEMITITQTVPGILACNSAVYIGWRLGGYGGAFSALVGSIVPSLVVIMLIAAGMQRIQNVIDSAPVQGAFKGIIGCIVGMVIVTAVKMRKKAVRDWFGWCVGIGCLIGMVVFGLSPALLIVAAVAAGLLMESARRVKQRRKIQ